jgi:hypothetical protein
VLRNVHRSLGNYAAVYLAVTPDTSRELVEALERLGAVAGVAGTQIGIGRRVALQHAYDGGHQDFLHVDFDRWLHWADRYGDELLGLPSRIASLDPPPRYVCLGRSRRAMATHPRVQQMCESCSNLAISQALGRSIDATTGACWIDRTAAHAILAHSIEPTNATDLEWPAICFKLWPNQIHSVPTEGLEFETADYQRSEIASVGYQSWLELHYENTLMWSRRLEIALASVHALRRVLLESDPVLSPDAFSGL